MLDLVNKYAISLSLLFTPISYADIIINNDTNQYLTFYITSNPSCLETYVSPETKNYQFKTFEVYKFCQLYNPCYGYLYNTSDLTRVKGCHSEFLAVFVLDIKRQIVIDLVTFSNKYNVSGRATNYIDVTMK